MKTPRFYRGVPFREEGAFHLNAHKAGATLGGFVLQPHSAPECGFQTFIGQRHGSRGKGRDAVLQIEPGHFDQTFVIAVGEVRTGISVGMHVHQTGNDIGVFQIHAVLIGNRGQNLGESAVFHPEASVDKAFFGVKDIAVFVQYLTPPTN